MAKAKKRAKLSPKKMKEKNPLGIVPLGDKLLIKPEAQSGESKTDSGIILPGKNPDEKQERGVIVAKGLGRIDDGGERVPMEVNIGDKVYFTRGYDVQIFKIQGQEYMLIPEHNVLAIIQ